MRVVKRAIDPLNILNPGKVKIIFYLRSLAILIHRTCLVVS